jgi:hypothetical protein
MLFSIYLYMETLQYIEQINTAPAEPIGMKPLDGVELYFFMAFIVVSILGLWFFICKALLDSLKK